jgi:hypothetical protein
MTLILAPPQRRRRAVAAHGAFCSNAGRLASEQLDGGKVRGGILFAHLRWADELGVRARLASGVGPETAQLLDGPVLQISWYPFRCLVEVDRAIAAAAGGDPLRLMADLGRFSAFSVLRGSHRFFARSDPHTFFSESARLRAQFLDFGTETYERLGERAVALTQRDVVCWAREFCGTAIGFFGESARLHGARDPHVVETRCRCRGDETCRFELNWQA